MLFVGLGQQQAEATSLLAIVPVAIVGASSRIATAMCAAATRCCWVASVPGTARGVVLANALSGSLLRDAFAALMLFVAAQLVLGALGGDRGTVSRRRESGSEGDQSRLSMRGSPMA